MISVQTIIVGAGFAGAATAYHLTRSGKRDVVVLEQETVPGFHSSGRNAAMIRQCVSDPALAQLARDGAAFLHDLPCDWPVPVQYKRNGSLLLGSGPGWRKLQQDAEQGRAVGVDVSLWTPERAKSRVPALEGADFEGAVWCASDGVLDIHALLAGYLKAAAAEGAQIRYGAAVRAVRSIEPNGFEIVTGSETFSAEVLVNAAGAWANTLGKMAGATELPLRACRRHLFISPPVAWVDKTWPFVWDVSHDIYFRPEGEGLLLCACDQDELPACDPAVDAAAEELLAEKINRFMPGLSSTAISRRWAGLRTLTPDGRFVIGWDPKISGFFWVVGLGGHGVTTSSAVGALAADLITAGTGEKSPAFSPERFLTEIRPR
jgi:glycine/D-amino acid oxidase-like deaminating enzyme